MHSEKSFSPSEYIPHLRLSASEVAFVHVIWNAVEPSPGEFNQQLIDEYAERCRKLQESGKTVCVTLFNNNDPAWFTREGGFTSLSCSPVYQQYQKKIITALSPIIDLWQPFRDIPELNDSSIGIIRETRLKIMQGNLAICQIMAYTEIHRQTGYTYTTPDGEIKHIAVLLPEGVSMKGWLENASNAKRRELQSVDRTLLDDSSIVSIESSSL